MKYETIKTQIKKPYGIIYLNRPECLNAFNGVLLNEVMQAALDMDADKDVKVILIKSLCEGSFSAGIDVNYVKDMDTWQCRGIGRLLHKCFDTLRKVDKVVIACIDGKCLGAGLELAISCDLLIATDRSEFGLPNINVGIPAIVEAAILMQAVGVFHTREMCYTGVFWDAQKAYDRGLLNRLCSVADFESTIEEFAGLIAQKSTRAMSTQKEIIHKWMTTDIEAAIDFSINTVCLNWSTKDQKEGMGAFIDKREAVFKGE